MMLPLLVQVVCRQVLMFYYVKPLGCSLTVTTKFGKTGTTDGVTSSSLFTI